MAGDNTDSLPLERNRVDDVSASKYNPDADEIRSAQRAKIDELKREQEQRVLDYMAGTARDTSSWQFLKDLHVSIVDAGVSILKNCPDSESTLDEQGCSDAAKTIRAACQAPVQENPLGDHVIDAATMGGGLERERERQGKLIDTLEGMSESDRRQLNEFYLKAYNKSLRDELSQSRELTPANREYALLLLARKDGETIERPKSKWQKELDAVDQEEIKEKARILHDQLGINYTDNEDSVINYDTSKKLVTVRNPWGQGEPLNADGDPLDGEKEDGVFTMTLEEFKKNFSTVAYSER